MMEIGRGGAYVPARVAPQGRIHRSIPHAQYVYFWYGNAATRTFGRTRRRRPYAFCLRELRVDICPYGIVWVDYMWVVDVVWADYAWAVDAVWLGCTRMFAPYAFRLMDCVWIYAFICAAFSMG